jgi:DNA replication protein DnaC
MVTIDKDNVTERERWVAGFSARDEPLADAQDSVAPWLAPVEARIRLHREAWAALTFEQQCEVCETEAAIAAFYEGERVSAANKQTRRKREANLQRSGCRLTDEATELVFNGQSYQTEALTAVASWHAKRAKPWLVLAGLTGCGKSYAAAEWVARHGGVWVRADELVRLWWANFGEQYDRQDAARNASLLVVDDVGCELDAARMLAVLLDLLDARKSARLHPTILTTNVTRYGFAERYQNDRLMSRMHESVEWAALDSATDLRQTGKGK